MATTKIKIGEIPIGRGEWNASVEYYKENTVTLYDMSFRAKQKVSKGVAPAVIGSDGKVALRNTDVWELMSGNPATYNTANDVEKLSHKVDNIKPIVINGNVTNAPDEEDITFDGNNLLKLKDRSAGNGMGYVILRTDKTFAEQVTQPNTIYEIRYDFDLDGAEVEIPENCVLKFDGGVLRKGKLIGNNTSISAGNVLIFEPGVRKYTGYILDGAYKIAVKDYNDLEISGSWGNSIVNPMWVGLDNINEAECSALKINKYVILHNGRVPIVLPKNNYPVYARVRLDNSARYDGSGSTIYKMDFDLVNDDTIEIPAGAERAELRSLYGVVTIFERADSYNVTLANLKLDGRRESRTENDAAINIGNTSMLALRKNGITLSNIEICNELFSACTTGTLTKLVVEDCYIHHCGEHAFYLNMNEGEVVFRRTKFRNTGDNDYAWNFRGESLVVKHDGELGDGILNYTALYEDCDFIYDEENDKAPCMPSSVILYQTFRRCNFRGVKGWTVKESLSETTRQIALYRFYDCTNPPYGWSTFNVVSEIHNCIFEEGAPYAGIFKDRYLIEGCSGFWRNESVAWTNRYTDAILEIYPELKTRPIIMRNCQWRVSGEQRIANLVNVPSILIENTSFDFMEHLNVSGYITVSSHSSHVSDFSITFKSCSFLWAKAYRFIYNKISDLKLYFVNCTKSGNNLPLVENSNTEAQVTAQLSNCIGQGFMVNRNAKKYSMVNYAAENNFYKIDVIVNATKDGNYIIDNTSYSKLAIPNKTFDISKAVTITQLSNFGEEAVCEFVGVTDFNGNGHVKVTGITKPTRFRLVIDFTHDYND